MWSRVLILTTYYNGLFRRYRIRHPPGTLQPSVASVPPTSTPCSQTSLARFVPPAARDRYASPPPPPPHYSLAPVRCATTSDLPAGGPGGEGGRSQSGPPRGQRTGRSQGHTVYESGSGDVELDPALGCGETGWGRGKGRVGGITISIGNTKESAEVAGILPIVWEYWFGKHRYFVSFRVSEPA